MAKTEFLSEFWSKREVRTNGNGHRVRLEGPLVNKVDRVFWSAVRENGEIMEEVVNGISCGQNR